MHRFLFCFFFFFANTTSFYIKDLSICGFWYLRGVQESIPQRSWRTIVYPGTTRVGISEDKHQNLCNNTIKVILADTYSSSVPEFQALYQLTPLIVQWDRHFSWWQLLLLILVDTVMEEAWTWGRFWAMLQRCKVLGAARCYRHLLAPAPWKYIML